jgi:hypothetical protein
MTWHLAYPELSVATGDQSSQNRNLAVDGEGGVSTHTVRSVLRAGKTALPGRRACGAARELAVVSGIPPPGAG